MTGAGSWPQRIALVFLFFSWGLMSVTVDMTIPYFKSAFDLGYRDALLIQSSFFLAYLLLARMAGRITARIGFRRAVTAGLVLMVFGSAMLAAATLLQAFVILLPGVFVIASGITFLQVSANPLAAAMGGTRSAAGNLTFIQGFNSLGTVAAPVLASFVLLHETAEAAGTSDLSNVRALFIGFAIYLALLALAAAKIFKVPSGPTTTLAEANGPFDEFARRRLWWGSFAIFAYVGAEVSVASTLVNFLESDTTFGSSRQDSARLVAFFWGGALAGRFLAVPLLTKFRRDRILMIACGCAALLSLGGLVGRGDIAGALVLSIGLFNAIQFPVIFAMSSADLEPTARARAAGWLCTGIVGGAVVPLAFGELADRTSLHIAMAVPALCYAYIAVFAHRYGRERDVSVAT